jgi:predicted tellurium resistance membrane protein TerC
VAELIVALMDLLEAEARELRNRVLRLGMGLALIVAAGGVFLIALAVLLWAFYWYLLLVMRPGEALLLTGTVALALTGVLFWLASKMIR